VQSADQFAVAEREAKARQLALRAIKMENPPYDFAPAFRALAQDGVQMLLLADSRPATETQRRSKNLFAPIRLLRASCSLRSFATQSGGRPDNICSQ
jgi:hypothetical protein